MDDTTRHIPLTPSEREARKRQKRDAKALKKAERERQKMENRIRLDKRPEIRMAAKLEKNADIPTPFISKKSSVEVSIEQNDFARQISTADRAVSLKDMSLKNFSLSLISYPPSSIVELDLSHNGLSEIPGLAELRNLVTLDIRRNEFQIGRASCRERV